MDFTLGAILVILGLMVGFFPTSHYYERQLRRGDRTLDQVFAKQNVLRDYAEDVIKVVDNLDEEPSQWSAHDVSMLSMSLQILQRGCDNLWWKR